MISTESGQKATKGYILIHGDIMSYKRLIEYQSNKFDAKDIERGKLLQNQSLRYMKPTAKKLVSAKDNIDSSE